MKVRKFIILVLCLITLSLGITACDEEKEDPCDKLNGDSDITEIIECMHGPGSNAVSPCN